MLSNLLVMFLLVGGQTGSPARLPGIVVILADDLGCGDLGAYNENSKIPTPHLDRLAAAGMRFTHAYSPAAVCTPTRYGLLTGRYSWRTRLKKGVLNGYSPALIDRARPTIASVLRKKGYRTACIGKWHLGLGSGGKTDFSGPLVPGPNTLGFDTFFGIAASLDMPPYVFLENDRSLAAPSGKIDRSEHRRRDGGGFWRAGAIAPGFRHIDVLPRLTEKAIAFIDERAREPEVPFFLYLPLASPHTPWLPTEEFRGKSKAGYYGDFVTQVDHSVGRVLAALDRGGLGPNTLVIFTSDNGAHWPVNDIEKYGHRANLGFRGQKADIWEGGLRVPFIARWPGRVPAGQQRGDIVCLTDIFRTVAGLARAKLSEDVAEDSLDIFPLLIGAQTFRPVRESVVLHSLQGMFAIREGRWKLILGRGSGGFTKPRRIEPEPGEPTGQLYDLARDPGENRNLYLEKPEIVERLTVRLAEIRK